jgi:hypothetical protein
MFAIELRDADGNWTVYQHPKHAKPTRFEEIDDAIAAMKGGHAAKWRSGRARVTKVLDEGPVEA